MGATSLTTAGHVHHFQSTLMGPCEELSEVLVVARPGGGEDLRLGIEDDPDLVLVGAMQQQVEPERPRGLAPNGGDLGHDLRALDGGHTVDPEPARVADGGNELWRCGAAHARQNDRVLDANQLCERSPDHKLI